MIKLLIFDYNGIIADFPAERWYYIMGIFMKRHDIDSKRQDMLWKRIKDSVDNGKVSLSKAQDITLKKLGVNNEIIKKWKELDVKIIENNSKLRPFVLPTIKKLKKKYKIAILSDAVHGRKIKHETLRRNKMNMLFDGIYCSCDIGIKKPDKRAFFTVLNRFKVKPSEAVFIGHSKDEVEGARKFKIRTIAVDWNKGVKSDFYIKKFSEIPKIIEKIK